MLAPVWIKTALHGFHNYDLGIFAQALRSIQPGDLNPFLPAFSLRVFNDHFDPILILFAPLARLLEPAYAALTIEHALILLSPLPILLLCRKDRDQWPFACLATTYLLFNRGILSALAFPVHPTTWAAFFFVATAATLVRGRLGWLALAATLLMACKEEFPFPVGLIGLALLARKELRAGAVLLVLASAWSCVAFGIRPWLMGDTHNYASRVLGPLFSAPLGTLGRRMIELNRMERLAACLLPLLPVAFWRLRSRGSFNWPLVAALAPLLAIRFLDGAWKFHYMAPVAAALVLSCWTRSGKALPWRYSLAGVAMTLLFSAGALKKDVAAYGSLRELGGARMAALDAARSRLLSQRDGKALVEGNLTPLLASRPGVYQIGGVQPAQDYRFVLAEKPPDGDPWPLKHSDVEALIAQWRGEARWTVLRDDDHLFLAEIAAAPTR